MTDKKLSLIFGSLLHDIGKVLYRYNDGRNHSTSGYDYIRENFSNIQEELLHCVKYHHAGNLKNANIPKDDACYITYIADNIAAFIDRRQNDSDEIGFDKNIPYQSVFNIINDNNKGCSLTPGVLDNDLEINYPTDKELKYDESFYSKIIGNITNALKEFSFTEEYANSLISILEANLSYIPSSTQTGEIRDISLFDHVKITTAIASCIYDYLESKGTKEYDFLSREEGKFYDEKIMLLYSLDISGIQKFIYTISSKGALKGLRARSFYLDILLENSIDNLLNTLELTKANALYLGGGHGYLLLPNTQEVKDKLDEFETEINAWFLDKYKDALYLATGYVESTPNNLRNEPKDSYKSLFRGVGNIISSKKLHRYSADKIKELNSISKEPTKRECAICKAVDHLNENGLCENCNSLNNISSDLLSGSKSFFIILNEKPTEGKCLEFPFNNYIIAMTEKEALEAIKGASYVRSYSKNAMYTGFNMTSKIWLGDYSAKYSFEDLINDCHGIKRLGVLRADVDNLGQAFVSGFKDENVSISRTSTFSRMMSLFFKYYINGILKNGRYQLYDDNGKGRNATIVYAGGDDIFVVGGWDDIICFAIDLHNSFNKFSEGALTISAGIGIFSNGYPISAMARETGALEDYSKDADGKNSITLFDEMGRYKWDIFINQVLGEKYKAIQGYLTGNDEKGKSFVYNMLDLIRGISKGDKLNIARFAYLLARIAPDKTNSSDSAIEKYKAFSSKVYDWVQNEDDRSQLVTAIYIYIYSIRDSKGE